MSISVDNLRENAEVVCVYGVLPICFFTFSLLRAYSEDTKTQGGEPERENKFSEAEL